MWVSTVSQSWHIQTAAPLRASTFWVKFNTKALSPVLSTAHIMETSRTNRVYALTCDLVGSPLSEKCSPQVTDAATLLVFMLGWRCYFQSVVRLKRKKTQPFSRRHLCPLTKTLGWPFQPISNKTVFSSSDQKKKKNLKSFLLLIWSKFQHIE